MVFNKKSKHSETDREEKKSPAQTGAPPLTPASYFRMGPLDREHALMDSTSHTTEMEKWTCLFFYSLFFFLSAVLCFVSATATLGSH